MASISAGSMTNVKMKKAGALKVIIVITISHKIKPIIINLFSFEIHFVLPIGFLSRLSEFAVFGGTFCHLRSFVCCCLRKNSKLKANHKLLERIEAYEGGEPIEYYQYDD